VLDPVELLVFSVLWFAVALVAHVIVWRALRPARHIGALLKHFAVLLVAGLALGAAGALPLAPQGVWQWGQAILFYGPAALTYISLFSLVEQDSPSLMMVERVASAGESGCSEEELREVMAEEGNVVLQRLLAARADGLVAGDVEHGWVLTARGAVAARVSAAAQRVYRLENAG
jgi:hypothetical protein